MSLRSTGRAWTSVVAQGPRLANKRPTQAERKGLQKLPGLTREEPARSLFLNLGKRFMKTHFLLDSSTLKVLISVRYLVFLLIQKQGTWPKFGGQLRLVNTSRYTDFVRYTDSLLKRSGSVVFQCLLGPRLTLVITWRASRFVWPDQPGRPGPLQHYV